MNRLTLNRICMVAPLAMSLAAFLLAATAGMMSQGKPPATDEGALAHIFQLLIAGQIPFIIGFLLSADRARLGKAAAPVAIQIAAVAVACSPVWFFKM